MNFLFTPGPQQFHSPKAHLAGRLASFLRFAALLALCALLAGAALAQTNVTTQHYDISRTGANTNETILTPANVNTSTFGKLFSYSVDGWIYAQPLYMPGVTMGAGTVQAGTTHNVVFVATEHDSIYAFDADSNTGANANPLWKITLLDAAHGAAAGATTMPNGDVGTGDIVPEIGITSTPVIDPTTNTLYVVGKTKESANHFQRLHALDITTGLEKFGGPVTLAASVPGTGNGSSGGTLNWDPLWENNRASLLLLNGIVYIGFGSHGDNGPWHGWILAYNATTLKQTGAWCSTRNAAAGGIWMGGTGLAADVPSGKPFGRIFTTSGNGTYDATATYTDAMDYGDSIFKLDLNNGAPTMNNGAVVGDDFTPHDQATLNNNDADQASGGVVILPDSVGGGGGAHQLVQLGKSGRIYILNRENLGGYNANNTKDPEEKAYVNGLWGAPAYWNGNIYVWSTNDNLKAFSFANGAISSTYTSKSGESVNTYSPTPTVSANGTTNGIVWSLKTDNYGSQGNAILYAHDASNVATLLYSSTQATKRDDSAGLSVKFIVPTVINGKVYTGSEAALNVYGLLSGETQAATPTINPASESFTSSFPVTLTDSTSGASIYYTTDGSLPSTASTKYATPFTVSSTTTVNAIAAGTGFLQSPVASATYLLVSQVATPTFSPAPGAYTAVQSVIISTTTANTTIYYTLDGTTPTRSSNKYTAPVSVGATETLSAFAIDNNKVLVDSPVASGLYTIDLGGVSSINFGSGFTAGGMALLGNAKLNGTALRLTDGGATEASAAWYNVPANIQTFTTDFTFLITPGTTPTADGFTFTIQGNNASAIGYSGGGLGYGSDSTTGTLGIANSVAVKFDLYSNGGEGVDSTGLYTNGASPTVPFVDMSTSGINLHSSDPIHAHFTYDGANLVMTLTDTVTNGTFTYTWPINIPATVGGNTAYVGFTGGSGGNTAIQDIQTWTFASTGTQFPAATPTFSEAAGVYLGTQTISLSDATSGASIFYTTDGTTPATSVTGSTLLFSTPITLTSTKTINAIATANGFTPSAVASATYTIESQVAAPTFSPAVGTYANSVTVSISPTAGATIYYTTNGITPTHSSTVYSGAITLTSTTTIQAIAAQSGFFDSTVASATYTISLPGATPVTDAVAFGDKGTASSTVATPAFSTTAANELLLAFVATDYLSGANTTVTGVAGAGLPWTLVIRSNKQSGTSEIWRALSPSPLSNVTVTATLSSSVASSITVMSFENVDTTGTNGSGAIGATTAANAASGAPTASLKTTRNNSLVVGVGNDYDNAIARAPASGQSLIHQYLAPIGDTYWVQALNASTPLSGTTVTVNDTAPTGDRYNLAIAEILPAATVSQTYSIAGNISPAASASGATITLSGPASLTANPDGSGNYTFAGLANGTYTVTPTKAGFTFTPSTQSVTVSGANVTAVNFTISPIPTYAISGSVTPLANGVGVTMTLSGPQSGSTATDSSGNYSFTGLSNGSYTVTPSKSGFTFSPASQSVTVSGANVTAVNFTISPIPTYTISGSVTPLANGVGVTMTLSGPQSGSTATDSSGNYSFTGLSNGSYTVAPSKTGLSFTPASAPVTITNANVSAVNFTAQTVTPTSIATDATVFTDQGSASTTLVSPAFSTTSTNELVLAFLATDDPGTGSNITVTAVSGAGLTWTLVGRSNTQRGTSEIWRAFSSATLSKVSVTATLSKSVQASITVMSFSGVSASGTGGSGAIGATIGANASSGAPTATLVTTHNNSLVVGVGNDYDNAIARIPAAGQTLVHQYLAPVGDTYWVQRFNATTPLSGTSVSLSDTAPTGDRYNLFLCEILPAP